MTYTSREAAYAALFNKISSLPGVVTNTRRLKHWEDVSPEQTPAFFLECTGESRVQQRGLDAKVTLKANAWFYVFTEGAPAGPLINQLLDTLDNALKPSNQVENTQTLGDVVHHCWVEGETQIFEGNLDDEAVAIVPVLMLIT